MHIAEDAKNLLEKGFWLHTSPVSFAFHYPHSSEASHLWDTFTSGCYLYFCVIEQGELAQWELSVFLEARRTSSNLCAHRNGRKSHTYHSLIPNSVHLQTIPLSSECQTCSWLLD